jgi:hypothetical protein
MPFMYMMTFHNPGPLNLCFFTIYHCLMHSLIYLKGTRYFFFGELIRFYKCILKKINQ